MRKIRHFLFLGSWLTILCLLMLLTAARTARAATADFSVHTTAGRHSGYMGVSVTIHIEPASRIALAATLTNDAGSVLRAGTVFKNEPDTSLTIDFSLLVDPMMTGTEDHIHISCVADANGETYTCNRSIDWVIAHDESVNLTAPTCSSAGYTEIICSSCGYRRSFTLPADPAGHKWQDWTSNNDGTHTRTCIFDPSHTETENLYS